MKRTARLRILIGAAVALAAVPAEAYYHYVYYPTTQNAPVFAHFDINALPNKTVTFLVTDTGPSTLASNDSFASVLGQVKQAAQVWNSVAGSDLRVAFGGVKAANQASNLPGGDVVFVDLPPGLLGMGTPTLPVTPLVSNGPNGPFVAFSRSTVMLTNNTAMAPGPSYLESFFTTAVHEMGHALGLQHTFTGSAMSQGVVRNTSRTRPIDADDIAGLSLLYGNARYAGTVGSISGHVFSNGQGVALASVVALTAAGPAISTLTNPDGSYEIDGLPPGRYWVYVHPIPPDADIDGPFDATGHVIPASGPTETLFYPGTRDPVQFGVVPVAAGGAAGGIDFSVGPRTSVPVYDMTTYSYSGQLSITPAFVNTNLSTNTIAAQAAYPLPTPVPQSVTVTSLGNVEVQPYGSPVALGLYLPGGLVPGAGPRHLLFNFGNDMYVLPDGVVEVQHGPPAIAAVTPNADGTVTVSGGNLGPDSQVYFDGLPATVSVPFSGTAANGSVKVTPPPGASGQTVNVIVYNSDEQNSTFYQSQAAPTYTYPVSGSPQITVSPSSLPAGASAAVDIAAANMQLVDGQVTVGLGTFDAAVRRIWVLSPTHAIANVTVAADAATGGSDASVLSGFQPAFQSLGFQIQAANPAQASVSSVVNADTNQQTLYPGAAAVISGVNLAGSATPQVTLNGQSVTVLSAASGQIKIAIPGGVPIGPAILKISNGSSNSFPFAAQIDNAPPVILGVVNSQNQPVGGAPSVFAGDTIFVTLSGVDAGILQNPGRLSASAGGVQMPVLQVSPGLAPGTIQVAVKISQSFGGSSVPLLIRLDASFSDPYSITVL